MPISLTALSLVILLLFAPLPATSAEQAASGGPVRITADQLAHEAETGTMQATGDVQIRWDGATLSADRVSVQQKESRAEAAGNVTLKRDDNLLHASRVKLNYETEQGEVEDADLFVGRGNFHLRGEKLAKTGLNEYHLEKGSFTTCDGERPSWRFTASDLDVTVEQFASGKHALFYVGPIPVFYTPYILFPVKRERQSGFLFPRIGNSSKKGFSFDLPYYWAISPSRDVTFDLDLQTKRGLGVGAVYQYLGRNGSNGSLRQYAIYDTDREKVRGDVALRQYHYMSSTIDLRSDMQFVYDREFYRDYGEAAGEYNRQFLDSSLAITKRGESAAVTAEGRYFQDLYASTNDTTLQRLPILTGSVVGERLGKLPLYASLDAEFTHFYRESGIQGQRLDLHPSLKLYWPESRFLRFSAWGGYRERLYNGYGAVEGDGYEAMGLFDAGATAGSMLEKTYAVSWGKVNRVRHTLIPEVGYGYVEQQGQDRLPFFDFNDRIPGGSLFNWSLANYVTGKIQQDDAMPEYRNLLFLRLSQGYQIGGSRRDLLNPVDEGRHFTDIRLEARANPWKPVLLTTDNRYNPYRSDFSTASAAVDVSDAAGNSLGAGYSYVRDNSEYLEGRLGLTLVKPFIFHYTGRYSVDGGRFLESYFSLEFKRQCWSVTLTYRNRIDNYNEFLVNFTLAGIGSLGQVKAF